MLHLFKYISNGIRRRSYLENVYFFKKKRQVFESMQKKKRKCKKFFNKLNPSFVNDNKLFWKAIKPLFSNKGSSGRNIQLMEKDEMMQDDKNLLKI